MIVQAFIPNWPGEKQHARELLDLVDPYCSTVVLDDPKDYFNAQWEKARKYFTGDVLLWIMADISIPFDFGAMYNEMIRVMNRGDIGWYAPDAAWTCYYYHKTDLRRLESEIFQVPNTDSLCFAIRGDVVRALPYMDPNLSFMWGMDFAASAQIELMGLKTVRDYRFKIQHPNSTGYDIDAAGSTMYSLWATFPTDLQLMIQKKVYEANTLKRWPGEQS